MKHNEIEIASKELEALLGEVKEVVEQEQEWFEEQEEATSSKISERVQRWRQRIRSNLGLITAFLVPILILALIFIQRGIFPFGEETFLRMDMYHQYAPFLSEFQNSLLEGSGLSYNWNMGLGINFSALYAYYLASPLNWLVVLWPKQYLIEFLTFMVVLKTGLGSLSFAYYLKKQGKGLDFGIAFFGIFYGLSGFMAAYSWNVMWLDCIVLFPLIVLGLERLIRQKKGFLYAVTLGICILSNYYISIMICMFLVMYFIALLILENKKPWKAYIRNVGDFILYSLLAGGLSAVVLLPAVFALSGTASGNIHFPTTFESYFPMFDMLARHISNVQSEVGLEHWPNIYSGVAVLLFLSLYLVARKISFKEKMVYCSLLVLFLASFSINVLNFIWHGFHYPNSLPARQSFIYIFLMLFVCYRGYMQLKDTPWRHIGAAFGGAVGFIIVAEKFKIEAYFHFSAYYLSILFLGLYTIILYLYKKKKNLSFLCGFALVVVMVEATMNMAVTSVTTTSRTNFVADNQAVERLISNLLPEDEFYRVDKLDAKTKNDGAWMNFPSASIFSSTANAGVSEFFKKIGAESSANAYSTTGVTPLIDALFGIRYRFSSEFIEDHPFSVLMQEDEGMYLYENPFALSLGFRLPEGVLTNWDFNQGNPAQVQNEFVKSMGVSPVLEQVDSYTQDDTFSFTAMREGQYFVYVENTRIKGVSEVSDGTGETFENVNRGFLLDLGYRKAGEEVVLKAKEEGEVFNARAYQFMEEALYDVYEQLSAYPLEILTFHSDNIHGQVDFAKEGVLFTSIPYDKGWRVMIDGREVETQSVFDTFLGVNVEAGSHEISLVYRPQGLGAGIWISIGSVLLLLLGVSLSAMFLRKKQMNEDNKE